MKGRNPKLIFNPETGKHNIFQIELTPDSIKEVKDLINKVADKLLEFFPKIFRAKRSNDANNYCWLLCGKLAEELNKNLVEVLNISKDEMYFDMLKKYGQGATLKVQEKDISLFEREHKYYEECHENKFRQDGVKYYRFWLGSSLYNTEEMAHLIRGIVGECINLGIETKTERELKELEERWKP